MTDTSPPAGGATTIDLGKILCPLDVSDFSKPVLAHAVALGRWYGAEVTALHVFATPPGRPSVPMEPGWTTEEQEIRASVTRQLQSMVDAFAAAGTAVVVRFAEGDAASEIVRHADEMGANLIVMGTHGRGGFDRLALGSVAEKVLRKASGPVMTLPPGAPQTPDAVAYRQILCPVDFSPPSDDALRFAGSIARKSGAAITLVHVIDALDPDESLREIPKYLTELRRLQRKDANERLDALVAAHRAAGRDMAEVVTVGRPYREILKVASERGADLIVMGVRGRGPVDLTLFGSTTNQVVRQATCPVVTVRCAD